MIDFLKSMETCEFLSADNLLKTIDATIESLLKRQEVFIKAIKVGKRNNDFEKGDIFLSRGCADISEQVLSSLQEKLMAELSRTSCYCKTIKADKLNSFVFRLNREHYFKNVLTSVLTKTNTYGKDVCQKKQIVLVNSGFCNRQGLEKQTRTDNVENTSNSITFDSMRSLVLDEHLSRLLKANGYTVSNILSEDQSNVASELCSWLGINPNRYSKVSVSDEDTASSMGLLEGHNCIVKNNRTNNRSQDMTIVDVCPGETAWDLNLRKYLEQKSLHVGKNGFDSNLKVCSVKDDGTPTDVFRQAVMLHQATKCQTSRTLIHIEGQSYSFTAQKVDLLVKILAELEPLDQLHFVYGGVTQAKGSETMEDFDALSYLRTRKSQMREAAVMKYGDSVQGPGWEETLQSLTLACVKFELLSNVARNTIKLKLDSREEGSVESNLQGSFVMYNCARLATLLSHFEDGVRKGTYPALPPLDTVDFSTLREEEEWGLLFNYVYPYPDIVQETVKMINGKQTLFASFHTHKICQMLIGLSRSVSSYYSRYHVLGEPRQHLLPTMYARLYLLKAVHQVMVNSLSLMGISPLSQL